MLKKILTGILLFIVSLFVIDLIFSHTSYTYEPVKLEDNFDSFYKNNLEKSKKLNVRQGNEEKLVRYSKDKTDIAILYIHGFKACRAEGEFVIDQIAKKYKANTYYLRLPGHGTNKDDQSSTSYRMILDKSINTLFMMEKLGKKVIIVGTSLGSLIGLYLAAEYPDKVSGLVMVSPFFNFASGTAQKLSFYPLYKIMSLVTPELLDEDPVPKEKDNWTLYWYKKMNFTAIKILLDMKEFVANNSVYEKVKTPLMVFYYYKNEKEQDSTASVEYTKKAFSYLKDNNKLNVMKAIATGPKAHVLMSKYIPSDKKSVKKVIIDFIDKMKSK